MANEKTKEFDRSVCFTFYRNYLERAETLKGQSGYEAGYEYLANIAKYALFEEEPEDPTAQAILDGLKRGIDSNQERRKSGYDKRWQ